MAWAVVKREPKKPRTIVRIKFGKLAATHEAQALGGAKSGYYVERCAVWLP